MQRGERVIAPKQVSHIILERRGRKPWVRPITLPELNTASTLNSTVSENSHELPLFTLRLLSFSVLYSHLLESFVYFSQQSIVVDKAVCYLGRDGLTVLSLVITLLRITLLLC